MCWFDLIITFLLLSYWNYLSYSDNHIWGSLIRKKFAVIFYQWPECFANQSSQSTFLTTSRVPFADTLSYVWMHTVLEKPPTGSSISCVTTILKLINSVHSKRQTWIGLRNRLRYDVLRCAVGNIMSIFFYVWMPIVLQKPLTGSSVSCVTVVMKLIYSVHFKRHTWIGLSQLISILIQ